MDIILIRHGESEDNIRKAYSTDETRLTKTGRDQIVETRDKLQGLNYNKVFISPIYRTKETAEILNLDGVEESSIRELDFGIFKGKTFHEISDIYPEETKEWNDDIFYYSIPQGESINDGYERISEFLDRISKEKENVVLITHDGVIRLALCWVLGNIEHFFKFRLRNGSISVISINEGFNSIKNVNL